MQALQEQFHPEHHDYKSGSPHLKHDHLYQFFVRTIRSELSRQGSVLNRSVLEIGAGDGAFVEPLLAAGATVTVTEMSRPAIAVLRDKFGSNPNFTVHFDPCGDLNALESQRFDMILYASVLHHIPDYHMAMTSAVSRHLVRGGVVMSLQDPMLSSTITPSTKRWDRATYLFWRLNKGSYLQGAMTRIRRIRGVFDPSNPIDMAEYHAVRNGVDQLKLSAWLSDHFAEVELCTYWTSQSTVGQRLGEQLGLKNTFMLVGRNYDSDIGDLAQDQVILP
jgi:SAM-dependent methyltransferase